MIKTLEERKKDYLAYITEEYKPKYRRWWENEPPDYKTTREATEGITHFPQDKTETIIQYDTEGALVNSALFFMGCQVVPAIEFYYQNTIWTFNFIFFSLAGILGLLTGLPCRRKREPRIRINHHGIWLYKMEHWIEWNYLAESFIQKVEGNDTPSFYLILHYYDEQDNSFKKTAILLNDLDVNKNELAADIEYRKRIAG